MLKFEGMILSGGLDLDGFLIVIYVSMLVSLFFSDLVYLSLLFIFPKLDLGCRGSAFGQLGSFRALNQIKSVLIVHSKY